MADNVEKMLYSLVDEFLVYLESVRGLSANSIRTYRNDLNHLMEQLGRKKSVAEITMADLRNCIAWLSARKLSSASVNSFIAAVRTFFAYCRKFGYIETNVAIGTKLISHKEDYHSEKDLLEFVCGSCGSHFKKRWHDFVGNENKVCAECFRKIQQNYDYVEERRNSLEEYQKIASQSGLKILSESIDNLHSKVIVEDKEGYKGQMWAVTLLRGSSFEKFSCRNPYSIWNINHYIELKELKNT